MQDVGQLVKERRGGGQRAQGLSGDADEVVVEGAGGKAALVVGSGAERVRVPPAGVVLAGQVLLRPIKVVANGGSLRQVRLGERRERLFKVEAGGWQAGAAVPSGSDGECGKARLARRGRSVECEECGVAGDLVAAGACGKPLGGVLQRLGAGKRYRAGCEALCEIGAQLIGATELQRQKKGLSGGVGFSASKQEVELWGDCVERLGGLGGVDAV